MKRAILFVLFGVLGVGALVHVNGGWHRARKGQVVPEEALPAQPTERLATKDNHELTVTGTDGMPVRVAAARGIVGYSRTETLLFRDPSTGSEQEIRGWFTHRLTCASVEPQQTTRGSQQAARCRNVLLEVFRKPRTLAEARARAIDGDLESVIEQRLVADEAVAMGPMAFSLNKDVGAKGPRYDEEDVIHLKGNVRLQDFDEGIVVTGQELLVRVKDKAVHRIEGTGAFRVVHDALVLTGDGIEIDQVEQGWTRVRILENPRLQVSGVVRDRSGKSLLPLGGAEGRHTEIVSRNEAILVRETGRRETRLRIRFPRGVRAEQTGGRDLTAGALELLATRSGKPALTKQTGGEAWTLREFHAFKKVAINYTNAGEGDQPIFSSIRALEVRHVQTPDGRERTELTGKPYIVLRGALPLGSFAREGDRLHISSQDKAWIEPLDPALVDPSLEPGALRRLVLQGAGRVERHNPLLSTEEDILAAESIDLRLLQRRDAQGKKETIATSLIADRNVELDGTHLQGTMERLEALDLHTLTPSVVASGKGTNVTFPFVQQEQGLLHGPAATKPGGRSARSGGVAPTRSTAEATRGDGSAAHGSDNARWQLQRLLAAGNVDTRTHLQGPTLGLPTTVYAHELAYEHATQIARIHGTDGSPARLISEVAPGQQHELSAPTFRMNQALGRLSAGAGVRGHVWVLRDGGSTGFGALRPPKDVRPLRALTLRTDKRIEVRLIRDAASMRLALDQEQHIRVEGPLQAEMRSDRLVVDRLRAESLDVTMVRIGQAAARTPAPSAPFARVGPKRGGTPSGGPQASRAQRQPKAAPRERVDIACGQVEVQLRDSEVEWLDAFGGVDLSSTMGRVTGARLRYDTARERIDVVGGGSGDGLARALFGEKSSRTEIEAAKMGVLWRQGRAEAVDAQAPAGQAAHVRLFRHDPARPDRIERYEVRYQKRIHVLPTRVEAVGVRIVRTVREQDGRIGAPAALYAESVQIFGSDFLTRNSADVREILARGPSTYLVSGLPDKQTQIWCRQIRMDVPRSLARLDGPDGVTVRSPGQPDTKLGFVVMDLNLGLPVEVDARSVRWLPPKGR